MAGASKGPAGAVYKTVSIEEAMKDEQGEAPAVLTGEDRNSGRALPTTGIRLVSPGQP